MVFLCMGTRELDDLDRTIAETRAHIEVQQNILQKYKDAGQITDAALAAGILRALEKSLEILEGRRRTELGALRPRATAKARSGKVRRQSGGS